MGSSRETGVPPTDRLAVGEDGMSLVEVLIAILLLGVILSATASSLVQFGRTAADNERRVQASALQNRLQEELQALAWDDAVVYEDDLAALDGTEDGLDGLELVGSVWMFDGEEVVSLVGPGDNERRDGVPELTQPMIIDGRDYEVVRLVTWSERDPDVKRFTTIVRWRLYHRVYEERFFSLRAATSGEAGDPERPRVVQFHVGPSPMELEYLSDSQPAQNVEDIEVVVRFSQGVSTATVHYESVHVVPGEAYVLHERELGLTPYITDPETGLGVAFQGVIPAGFRTFPNGMRRFEARGSLSGETYTGATSMEFVDGAIEPEHVGEEPVAEDPVDGDGDGSEEELVPVKVSSVTVSPTTVCLDANNLFVEDVTITALIDGLAPTDHVVTVAYTANGTPQGENLPPLHPETFGPTNASFRLVLAAGVDHGFRPHGHSSAQHRVDETEFTVTARRPSDEKTDDANSLPQKLRVYEAANNSC